MSACTSPISRAPNPTPPPGGTTPAEVLDALLNPARPLYLGRRSCPPSERIPVATTGNRAPLAILNTAPLLRDPGRPATAPRSDADYFTQAGGENELVMVETTAEPGTDPLDVMLRPDTPTTFDPRRLHHENRPVTRHTLLLPPSACAGRGSEAVAALYESLGAGQ